MDILTEKGQQSLRYEDKMLGVIKEKYNVDVIETDKTYELRIAVPGLTKDDIKVDVKSGCLTVEAKKVDENGEENYLYKGLSSFEFNRSFSDLDENLKVDMESISSKYRNGLLIVSLPKKKEAMPREISVEVS